MSGADIRRPEEGRSPGSEEAWAPTERVDSGDQVDARTWPRTDGRWTFLAPMEGVTHSAFRELLSRRGGIGVVCTEFVRIAATPVSEKLLRQQVIRASRSALSVQVMGNHVEHLSEATRIVAEAGADIVDLNVGCPAPRAVRKGVGSALLRDPVLLGRVVATMRRCAPGFLSAKIRAGFEDASGAVHIARVIEDSGADLIAVHPRRRSDFYDGVADWRIIANIVNAVSIPVVGNGDVWYASDALRMREETGCSGVMVGRGAMRNPWIFEQIEALVRGREPLCPGPDEMLAHFDELACMLGAERPRGALGMLKEQVRYLARALPDGAQFARRALRSDTAPALRGKLAEQLERTRELDCDARGGQMERSGSALR